MRGFDVYDLSAGEQPVNPPERLAFPLRQNTRGAGLQGAEFYGTERNTNEPSNFEVEEGDHSSDLAVATLGEFDFEDGQTRGRPDQPAGAPCPGRTILEVYPSHESPRKVRARGPVQRDLVSTTDL